MDKTQQKIIDGVCTSFQCQDKAERLQLASQTVFQTDKTLEKRLSTIFNEEDLQIINKLCQTLTPNELKKFFQKTADSLAKIPVVHITVGASPTQSVALKIHHWLTQKLGKHVLVDLISDESNSDQVIVEYQGRRSTLII